MHCRCMQPREERCAAQVNMIGYDSPSGMRAACIVVEDDGQVVAQGSYSNTLVGVDVICLGEVGSVCLVVYV